MKVRRLTTDLEQISRLIRYSKIKNSPRTFRPFKDPDTNTKTIYLQQFSPNSITPMTIKLKKYDTTTRDSQSKSPFSYRGFRDDRSYYYNPKYSARNYLESARKNLNTIENQNRYKNISTTSRGNCDSIKGLKNSLIPRNKKEDGWTLSEITRNNRFITISPCSTSNAYNDNRNNSSKDDYNNISCNLNTNWKIYKKNNNHSHNMRNILSNNIYNELYLKDLPAKSPYSIPSRKSNKNSTEKDGLRISAKNSNNSNKKNYKDKSAGSQNNNYYNTNTPIYQNYNNNNKKEIEILLSTNSTKRSKKTSSKKHRENKADNPFFVSVDIKVNELLTLEEKLNNIIRALIINKNIFQIGASSECSEFMVFYYNSSLQNRFAYFFSEGNNRIIAQSALNLLLYIIILTYHLSKNPTILTKIILILKKIYQLLKMNLYLFYKQIQIYNGENFTYKYQSYFKSYNYILKRNNLYDKNESYIIQIINENCRTIVSNINLILNFYESSFSDYYLDFLDLFNNLSRLTEQDFNNYFYNNLYNTPIKYIYNQASNFKILNNQMIQNQIDKYKNENDKMIINAYLSSRQRQPFIRNKNKKKYTLVLDLDETLISVIPDNRKSNNYTCKFRPGLVSFLNDIKPYYELISFTTNTKEYSKFIVSQIETNKIFFDYNLSREHSTLVGNDFVKDISKIGRDLKKIIIVDDIEENFRLNSDNGILISPYYGDDLKNDNVLYELKKLLLMFYKIGYDDLRLALRNYQSEIKEKISLCFD